MYTNLFCCFKVQCKKASLASYEAQVLSGVVPTCSKTCDRLQRPLHAKTVVVFVYLLRSEHRSCTFSRNKLRNNYFWKFELSSAVLEKMLRRKHLLPRRLRLLSWRDCLHLEGPHYLRRVLSWMGYTLELYLKPVVISDELMQIILVQLPLSREQFEKGWLPGYLVIILLK